jgi:hypothetical protein
MKTYFTPASAPLKEACIKAWWHVTTTAAGYQNREVGLLLTGTSALDYALGEAINTYARHFTLTDTLRRAPHNARFWQYCGAGMKEVKVHLICPGLPCAMTSGAILAFRFPPSELQPYLKKRCKTLLYISDNQVDIASLMQLYPKAEQLGELSDYADED